MRSLVLHWGTCSPGGIWCPIDVDLTSLDETFGVYVIWHDGTTAPGGRPECVRVGQGQIADRMRRHRTDPQITAYDLFGTLRFTWAVVNGETERVGIERYLADSLRPIVGQYYQVEPIAVNLPEWAT